MRSTSKKDCTIFPGPHARLSYDELGNQADDNAYIKMKISVVLEIRLMLKVVSKMEPRLKLKFRLQSKLKVKVR